MDSNNNRIEQKRLVILSISLFFLFSLLVISFYKIQIIDYDKWSRLAKTQHQMTIQEMSRRGIFYSNTSIKPFHPKIQQPFVYDVVKFHLHIDPGVLSKEYHAEIAKELETFLIEEHKCVKEELKRHSRSRRIAAFLDKERKEEIERWWQKFAREKKLSRKGIFFIKDYKRSYPFKHLLGQVLHTFRHNGDGNPGIATGGLELYFNRVITGSDGKRILLRTPRQRIEYDEVIEPAVNGCDIHLTINHFVQAVAEESLEKWVKRVGAKGGSVVVMDPKNGEIYAMANYPFFDPGDYSSYYNDIRKIDATRNRAVSDCFEPGSIMKPITIAIALMANDELEKRNEEPLFTIQEMISVSNNQFPGRTKPIKDLGQHRFLNMMLGIQKSSNVYVARLTERIIKRLGAKWYREQLSDFFCFGKRTGIELPCEQPGMVPEIGKRYQSGLLEWSTPTPFSLAMGYNLMVNQLQMLRAYSILLNDGVEVQPTIIKKITQNNEEIPIRRREKKVKAKLKTQDLKALIKAMQLPIKKGGTATLAAVPRFTVGGKTGTSEKIVKGSYSTSTHYSSFLGFAPVSDPKIIVIVGIDEPSMKWIEGYGSVRYGGKCSAPIFKEVTSQTLSYMGVRPDDPNGDYMMDEIEELRQLYNVWNKG